MAIIVLWENNLKFVHRKISPLLSIGSIFLYINVGAVHSKNRCIFYPVSSFFLEK